MPSYVVLAVRMLVCSVKKKSFFFLFLVVLIAGNGVVGRLQLQCEQKRWEMEDKRREKGVSLWSMKERVGWM